MKQTTVKKIYGIVNQYRAEESHIHIQRLAIQMARCLEEDDALKDTPYAEDFRVARTADQFESALIRLRERLRQASRN